MKFRLPWLPPLVVLSWTTLAVVGLGTVWRHPPARETSSLGRFPGIRPALQKESACVAS